MMRRVDDGKWLLTLIGIAIGWCCCQLTGAAESWPQFRGPNASGKATTSAPLPADLGPDSRVLWQTPLPSGHSSPVIAAGRIYLTGVVESEEIELVTSCLDQVTGEILWQLTAPYQKLEEVNPSVGSFAQSSCVANADRVVSFFGSAGMFCYDREGNLLWTRQFNPFKNDEGAGSSPILVDDRIILCQDHDVDSFLMAIRLHDGSTIWRTERPQFIRSYATPVIWNSEGQEQVVVAGSLMVKGYDLEAGHEIWTVRGLSWGVVATPVIGDGGLLYVPSLAAGVMEVNDRAPDFSAIDTDASGFADQKEFAATDVMTDFFTHFDRNKDGKVPQDEYDSVRQYWEMSRHVVLAIRPGGVGDVTDTHVAWSATRVLPKVPSPVVHDGTLFLVKDGGIVNCLDTQTGRASKPRRVSGSGDYFSSPVVGDGKIYLVNQRGEMSVITATRNWRQIGEADFGEETYATPAIVDGRIYLRTAERLYCLGYETPSDFENYLTAQRTTRFQLLGIFALCGVGILLAGCVILRRKWRG